VTDAGRLLEAYDRHLRTEAETRSATDVARVGPLWLAKFAGGRGFVTYPPLSGTQAAEAAGLVEAVLEHFRADPAVTEIEWKTRGHDRIPGLHEALVGSGFEPDDAESIMIGRAGDLVADRQLTEEVGLRQVTAVDDVRAVAVMQDEVFGRATAAEVVAALVGRLSRDDGTELWVAEAGGSVVGAGRLEFVDGSDFAGLWGGAVRAAWRGRGIYRALTSARARSAVAGGRTLIHSDCTELSRPILERSGLLEVSTTTPYVWTRSTQP
jgi:hypothetical protein